VVKALKKKEKGLCIIAGDISPIDVITHVPILCEENDVSYIYVPSKSDLGTASATKRPTSCVFVSTKSLESGSNLHVLFEDHLQTIKKLSTIF